MNLRQVWRCFSCDTAKGRKLTRKIIFVKVWMKRKGGLPSILKTFLTLKKKEGNFKEGQIKPK